jgi:hypothetical protein
MPHCQITLSTIGRERMFATAEQRVVAARAIARVGGAALRLFSIVDDHQHLVVACEVASASRLAGTFVRSLALLPGTARLAPSHVARVNDRTHLITLVRYVIQQPVHHGLGDAASWNGSCLADLVGARRLPGFDATALAADLPRLDIAETARIAAGLPRAIVPFDLAAVRAAGPARLWEATVACGALVDVAAHDPVTVGWRRAYVALAKAAEIAISEARDAAAMPRRTWSRLASDGAAASDLTLLRRRLAFDAVVATLSVDRSGRADRDVGRGPQIAPVTGA